MKRAKAETTHSEHETIKGKHSTEQRAAGKPHTTHTTEKEPPALLHKANPRYSDPRPRHIKEARQTQKMKHNKHKNTNSRTTRRARTGIPR